MRLEHGMVEEGHREEPSMHLTFLERKQGLLTVGGNVKENKIKDKGLTEKIE